MKVNSFVYEHMFLIQVAIIIRNIEEEAHCYVVQRASSSRCVCVCVCVCVFACVAYSGYSSLCACMLYPLHPCASPLTCVGEQQLEVRGA